MGKRKDLVGQTFHYLTVERLSDKKQGTSFLWECRCKCGNTTYALTNALTSGHKKSCGCLHTEQRSNLGKSKSKHSPGEIIGNWKIIKDTQKRRDGKILWECECLLCGAHREISTENMRSPDKMLLCFCQNNTSHGEQKIRQLLETHNIPFETEYKYSDLVGKKGKLLRFDFFVDNTYLIEYDGKQHFKEGSWENLKDIQERDCLKNNYAKEHNIPLIRIPYTHYDNLKIDDLLLSTSNFLLGGGKN